MKKIRARHFATALGLLLIGLLAINSGQALVMCTAAGGYQALEPAHPGGHAHTASSQAGAQVAEIATVPSRDCKDIPLGTSLTVSPGQDKTGAVALSLFLKNAPVLSISLDPAPATMPRLRPDEQGYVPLSQQQHALQTVVLLI